MGIETIEGYTGPGVVSERLISKVVRSDMPIDGGNGTDMEELMRDMAMAKAKEEALARAGLEPGTQVRFLTAVPYVGGEPLVEVDLSKPASADFPNHPA